MSESAPLKPYSRYRCPKSAGLGHGSIWTGAYTKPAERDGWCGCGERYVEVVEDGHTYRLSWEMGNLHDDGWHPTSRDSTDRAEIVDQWQTLSEWAATGAERVRNVRLERSATSWEPFDPDGASS